MPFEGLPYISILLLCAALIFLVRIAADQEFVSDVVTRRIYDDLYARNCTPISVTQNRRFERLTVYQVIYNAPDHRQMLAYCGVHGDLPLMWSAGTPMLAAVPVRPAASDVPLTVLRPPLGKEQILDGLTSRYVHERLAMIAEVLTMAADLDNGSGGTMRVMHDDNRDGYPDDDVARHPVVLATLYHLSERDNDPDVRQMAREVMLDLQRAAGEEEIGD